MTREVLNTNQSAARRRRAAAAAPEPPRRPSARRRHAPAAAMLSPKIIALEEGWNNEIKAKAIDVLASA